MVNNKKILGLLGLCTKAGEICCGTDACIDLIQKNKIKLIIIAGNAADRTKRNFKFLCNKSNIRIVEFGTIDEISKAIGNKNKAVIGIKNDNLSNEIYKIINGGEIIG